MATQKRLNEKIKKLHDSGAKKRKRSPPIVIVKEKPEAGPCKLTSGIAKFQRAVKKLMPENKGLLYYIKQAMLQEKLRKRKRPASALDDA